MAHAEVVTYQTEVMAIIGYTICQCQLLEKTISHCWLLNAEMTRESNDAFFQIWDIEGTTEKNSRKTLGALLRTINAEQWFKKPLRCRMSRFIKRRNKLIHKCLRGPGGYSLQRKRDLVRLHRLASNVIRDGVYFEQLFDAFLGMQSQLGLQIGALTMEKPQMLTRLMKQKKDAGIMREFMKVRKKFGRRRRLV